MNVKHFAALPALVLVAGAAFAGGPGAASPGLDRFKSLAGEWVAAEDGPMSKKGDLVARYVVTAGGSAVVETILPGQEHEMVTVYTADGSDVVLTHYCMEGNQPRMRAKSPSAARVAFTFDGGANIACLSTSFDASTSGSSEARGSKKSTSRPSGSRSAASLPFGR